MKTRMMNGLILGTLIFAAASSGNAWAAGCEDAYRAKIDDVSGKIDSMQSQLVVGGTTAATAEIALAAAAVITPPLAIIAGAPVVGILGYDFYLHEERKGLEHTAELLSEADKGEGPELDRVTRFLLKKHVDAKESDIAAAISRHDAAGDFCRPHGSENTPKLLSEKQIMKMIFTDLR